MQDGVLPTDEERLALIHDETVRLGRLTHSILDLSRLETGSAQFALVPIDLAAPVAALAAEYTQAHKPDVLAGKRIAITSFGVEYQTKVKAYGSSFGSTSSSTSVLSLDGVKPETMQAIADEAYAELVRDLTAAGYEVVDQATLEANDDYQRLKKRALASGEEINVADHDKKVLTNKSRVYSPKGAIFYRPAVDEAGQRIGTIGNMFSSLGNSMSPNKNLEADIGKALKANVLKVYYAVGFGSASASASGGYSGSAFNSQSQSVRVQLNLIGDGETRFSFRVPGKSLLPGFSSNETPRDGHAIVSLAKPLSGDSDILAGDVYKSTSASNRAGNALSTGLAALGALAGKSLGSSNTQEFTAPVDDARYGEAVRRHIGVAEDMLLYRLQQGK
jgi:hypothetical protein